MKEEIYLPFLLLVGLVLTINLNLLVEIKSGKNLTPHSISLNEEQEIIMLEIDYLNIINNINYEREKEREEFFARGEVLNNFEINRKSGRSLSEIQTLLSGTGLDGIAEAVFICEKKYSINSIFIISVAKLESGSGSNYLTKYKNNIFSLNAYGSTSEEILRRAYSYKTKSDSVYAFSEIIFNKYFQSGRTTLNSIGEIYAEDPNWANKIYNVMKSEVSKLDK